MCGCVVHVPHVCILFALLLPHLHRQLLRLDCGVTCFLTYYSVQFVGFLGAGGGCGGGVGTGVRVLGGGVHVVLGGWCWCCLVIAQFHVHCYLHLLLWRLHWQWVVIVVKVLEVEVVVVVLVVMWVWGCHFCMHRFATSPHMNFQSEHHLHLFGIRFQFHFSFQTHSLAAPLAHSNLPKDLDILALLAHIVVVAVVPVGNGNNSHPNRVDIQCGPLK